MAGRQADRQTDGQADILEILNANRFREDLRGTEDTAATLFKSARHTNWDRKCFFPYRWRRPRKGGSVQALSSRDTVLHPRQRVTLSVNVRFGQLEPFTRNLFSVSNQTTYELCTRTFGAKLLSLTPKSPPNPPTPVVPRICRPVCACETGAGHELFSCSVPAHLSIEGVTLFSCSKRLLLVRASS